MERLPPEIVYDIAGYAHSRADLLHLSQTSRRMRNVISTDNYRSLQAFIRTHYPEAVVPPMWRDALHALTVRQQAVNKHAIHARTLRVPPHIHHKGSNQRNRRGDRPTLGYRPPVDSYEVWREGGDWNDRKDVLAYGAGADLIVRIKNKNPLSKGTEWEPWQREKDNAAWLLHGSPEKAHSLDDITGVHLLPQLDTSAHEEVIYARRRGGVRRVVLDPAKAAEGHSEEVVQVYGTGNALVEKTDLDRDRRTLAVTLDRGPIQLFKVDHQQDAFAAIQPDGPTKTLASKLLSDTSIAVWSHRNNKAINLFDITESEVRETQSLASDRGRKGVYVVADMNPFYGTHLFLSGWQDGNVRLHDVRVPHWVGEFEDVMRDDPVYCIQPIGSTHFLSGLGAEGVIQLYDMRQPRSAISFPPTPKSDGFTMFLSESNHQSVQPYRGPIYSLSQPSSASSTVWVGMEQGISRLDLVFSTDLAGPASEWYSANCQISPYKWNRKGPYPDLMHFNLRGYQNGRVQISRYNGPLSRTLANPPFQSQTGFIAGMTQARMQRAADRNGRKQGRRGRLKKYEWRWADVLRSVPMEIDDPTEPRSDFEEEEIPWPDELEEQANENVEH